MKVELSVEDVVKDRSMKVSCLTSYSTIIIIKSASLFIIRSLMSDAGVHLNLHLDSNDLLIDINFN